MADDVLEQAGPAPETGKVKREPPTIDLEATKVAETGAASKAEAKATDSSIAEAQAGEAKSAEGGAAEAEPETAPRQESGADGDKDEPSRSRSGSRSASVWIIAPLSGLVAAALVMGASYLLGWPAAQTPPAPPEVSAASLDALANRVASLEAKMAKPAQPASDPTVTARLDTIEKSVASLRGDVATLRAQSDKLAASVSEAKTAVAGEAAAAAPKVDLSAINERLDQIERVTREQAAAIAGAKQAASKAAQDDLPLRRVVAAALLDVAVRHGDPYAGALAAAKALAPDPEKLKPLDQFADKGVPNPPMLSRELLALVPKLSPAAANSDSSTAGGGIVDRLKAGASSLVRIERTDAVGNDRGAVVARATAAALRNDVVDARRELASLDAADRAPAQAWLDKVAARDAALAASRQFADDMMAALSKSAQ